MKNYAIVTESSRMVTSAHYPELGAYADSSTSFREYESREEWVKECERLHKRQEKFRAITFEEKNFTTKFEMDD